MALSLPAGIVQVWETTLALPEPELPARFALLSCDERERADRFRFARDRTAFVAARSWLRQVLSAYLDRPAGGLQFRYGVAGKPELAPEGGGAGLRFNLSHSGERAVLAVTRGREVGIDIERIRPLEESKLARQFFAAGEVAALAALPEGERRAAFFRCWTRKEAFIKALGDGFARPLDSFDVSLRAGEPPRVLRVAGEPDASACWQLADLDVPTGYAGALASPSRGWSAVAMRGEPPQVPG